MTEKNKVFETLNAIDVNDRIEKKNGLTYLTWSIAWQEVKKIYPEAMYRVQRNESGLPYVYDPATGYMVFTSVTIEDVTHEMWLPVMNSSNKAMKDTSYTYIVEKWKDGVKKEVPQMVEAATMFDINKTIMRCLTKNLAMFGLGLYIYAGEDMPDTVEYVAPIAVTEPVSPAKEKKAAAKPKEKAPEQPAQPAQAAATPSPTNGGVNNNVMVELVKGSENWEKASKYLLANRNVPLDKLLAQLRRKYTIQRQTEIEIEQLLKNS